MVVIGSGNGDEALHFRVGDDYLLTTAGIGDILQISNLRFKSLYFGRTCMDKNQITDDGNQSTDFLPLRILTLYCMGTKQPREILRFHVYHLFLEALLIIR